MGTTKTILLVVLLCSVASAAMQAAQKKHSGAPVQDQPADDEKDDVLKEAEELLQKQQYQQAEEKLQVITAKQADNPQAWFDLGFAQSHQNKTADAIAAYRKATALSPKWFEAQQSLGLALAKSGDLASAASALKIAVTLKPTVGGQQALAGAWLTLAQTLEENQPQEALAAYQKAAELDPANSEATLGVAKMRERSGDAAASEQQYLKLAESGNEESMERLIGLYLQQKRYSDAETW